MRLNRIDLALRIASNRFNRWDGKMLRVLSDLARWAEQKAGDDIVLMSLTAYVDKCQDAKKVGIPSRTRLFFF